MGKTGLGRYQEGVKLEKQGLSSAEIAEKLGYKNAASWESTKSYYGKREEDIKARCQPRTANEPKPDPILAEVQDRRRELTELLERREEQANLQGIQLNNAPVVRVQGDLQNADPGEGCAETANEKDPSGVKIAGWNVKLSGRVADYDATGHTLQVTISRQQEHQALRLPMADVAGLAAELKDIACLAEMLSAMRGQRA